MSRVSELLSVNRTSIYYKKKEVSDEEIAIKHSIDKMHTDNPAWGSRQLSKQLQREGFAIGRRRTRRLMLEMAISVIYPKPNLSAPDKMHKIYPYLLKNAQVTRANQAWSIDITYIKLTHGFIYLTAIIDWYSRCIVGWELSDTLETGTVIRALKKAFSVSSPIILNSDQGSQFTSNEYIKFVESQKIQISMDGVGRWADNIFIERWFRTLKYEEVYIKDYQNIKEARKQIGDFICNYNFKRLHSSLNYETPAQWYYPILLAVATS